MKTRNPKFRERVQKYLEGQHFMHLIGFDLNVIEEGKTEGWLEIQQKHKQQKGFAHGGLVATLADIVAGFSAYTLVPEDHHVVTAEIKISYFNPGLGNKLHAIGYVVKQGRKINFCEAEVWDIQCDADGKEERNLIAKASTTMATIFPEELEARKKKNQVDTTVIGE